MKLDDSRPCRPPWCGCPASRGCRGRLNRSGRYRIRPERTRCLGGRPPDVGGARTFWTGLADLELDAVALAQLVNSLTVDGALVKEELVALRVLDESEPLLG